MSWIHLNITTQIKQSAQIPCSPLKACHDGIADLIFVTLHTICEVFKELKFSNTSQAASLNT